MLNWFKDTRYDIQANSRWHTRLEITEKEFYDFIYNKQIKTKAENRELKEKYPMFKYLK